MLDKDKNNNEIAKNWLIMYKFLRSVSNALKKNEVEKLKTLKFLLTQRDINLQHPDTGCTYLMQAINEDDLELIKLILAQEKVNLEVENYLAQSALFHAIAIHSRTEILAILIQNGAKLNALHFIKSAHLKVNLIQFSLQTGNMKAFHYFLDKVDINLYDDKYTTTPLYFCASRTRPVELKLLLEKGAKTDIILPSGENVLHILFFGSINRNTVLCLELFLKNGANPNQKTIEDKATPYAYFIERLPTSNGLQATKKAEQLQLAKQILQLFLDHGVQPQNICCEGSNLQTLLIKHKQNELLAYLIEKKGLINEPDGFGFTPLIQAIAAKNTTAFLYLIDIYESNKKDIVRLINQSVKILAGYASKSLQKEAENYRIENNRIKRNENTYDKLKKRNLNILTILVYLLEKHILDAEFICLIIHIWLINKIDKDRIVSWIQNSLKKYPYNKLIEQIFVAVNYLPRLKNEIISLNPESLNALQNEQPNVDLITSVLSEIFLISVCNNENTPIYLRPTARVLFQHANDFNDSIDTQFLSVLFNFKSMLDLISLRPKLEQITELTCHPLIFAIPHKEMLKLLLSMGAKIKFNCPETQDNILHECAKKNALEALNTILWADETTNEDIYELLKEKNTNGFNPLHVALIKNNEHVAEAILRYIFKELPKEQQIEIIDSQSEILGDTALSLAAHKGYANIVKLLLDSGANHKILRKDNQTPFSIAVHHLNSEVMQVMVEFYKQRKILPADFSFSLLVLENFVVLKFHCPIDLKPVNEISTSIDIASLSSNNNNQNELVNLYTQSFETEINRPQSGFSFIVEHLGLNAAKELYKKKIEQVLAPSKNSKVEKPIEIACFNYQIMSGMPGVKPIEHGNTKSQNCLFMLDIISLDSSQAPRDIITKYANSPIFFAAGTGDQGLVKLNLKDMPKIKRQVFFHLMDDSDKWTASFVAYVTHELKSFQKGNSESRIIVAKIKGEKGSFYIGFTYLKHGLHTRADKENFFKKHKQVTFYSPKTEKYKKISNELGIYQNGLSENNNVLSNK